MLYYFFINIIFKNIFFSLLLLACIIEFGKKVKNILVTTQMKKVFILKFFSLLWESIFTLIP